MTDSALRPLLSSLLSKSSKALSSREERRDGPPFLLFLSSPLPPHLRARPVYISTLRITVSVREIVVCGV